MATISGKEVAFAIINPATNFSEYIKNLKCGHKYIAFSDEGREALIVAASRGNLEVFRILIEVGAKMPSDMSVYAVFGKNEELRSYIRDLRHRRVEYPAFA
jgi:hypothetical protein